MSECNTKVFGFFENGGSNYRFDANLLNCYVKRGNESVASFETLSISGDSLIIDHFAVGSTQIGKKIAADVLLEFAALVSEQMPDINQIVFDLGRAASGTDIDKLAEARLALFKRLGASNVNKRFPNKDRIVVSATWEKNKWGKGDHKS